MRRFILLPALLLAFPAQAADPAFCKALETIVKAGMAPDRFKSVQGKQYFELEYHGTATLPGLGRCFTTPKGMWPSYTCHAEKLKPAEAAALETKVKNEIESCVGGTMVRATDISLEPWILRESVGSYPYFSLLKILDKQVTFRFVMPKD